MRKIIFTLIFTSITTVCFTQEIIDKVIAVIGEKELFSPWDSSMSDHEIIKPIIKLPASPIKIRFFFEMPMHKL